MSIKSKFEKIDLEKLKSDSPQAYGILNGWANSTKNFTDDKASEVVEPLFNKLYDKLATGKFWYVIEGNEQPKDQVAEPVTKKEEVAIVKEVVKSEPKEPKTKATKTASKKTHTPNANKPKHVPTPPKLGGKSVFEVAKELREKDPTLKQRDAVRMAGKMVKDAHNKAKDEELQSLMKMIKSDPRYSVLRPEKNTSIIRDLGRPAIRTAKRVSHKGWKNQYGASDGGRTYYENRVNRMDVDKVPMYAKGGETKSVLTAYANGDYDKKIKDFNSLALAKNFAKLNKNNYDSIMFEDEFGDNIYVSKDDTIKDIEDLFAESFAKGGELAGVVVYDNGGESFDRYTIFTPDGSVYGMSENASGFNMYIGDDTEIEKGSHLGKKLKSVPEGIKKAVLDRMSETFAKGGNVVELKEDDYVWNALGKKLVVDKVTDDEYYLSGFMTGTSPFGKEKVHEYIKNGTWSLTPKMSKGGSTHGNHLPTSNVEYFRKHKIDKLMIGGKEISEDDILSGVFAKKLGTGSNADAINKGDMVHVVSENKSGVVTNVISGGKKHEVKFADGTKNVYDKNELKKVYSDDDYDEFAKGGKVAKFDAYEVQEKIADLSYKVWNDLGINSGSEIYESDAVQKKMADAYKKAGIDDLFTQYSESERKEIAEALTDENQHSMRQYLSLRGYLGEAEKQDYTRLAKEYNKGGRKSFLEPKNIEEAKTTSTPKSGGKQGYIYVPKEDITSIEYMKDGESVIAKNSDILDGAYIKISSSSFAEGGRLPKGEVMYVPKKDIEDIIVVDSGFKANNITDELLSGIHIKASALSKQTASQSTPSKGAKFGTTRIYKGYNGWVGRTSVDNIDGADYEIVTMKRSNGKLWSNAQKGKNENGIFSFMVFGDDNTSLIETNPAKVTEKVVSEQHDKAIAKFKEMKGL